MNLLYLFNIESMSLSFYSLLSLQHSSTATNAATGGVGASESADDDLPSVMTCANYLKLPPYSTKVLLIQTLIDDENVLKCSLLQHGM